MTILNYLGRVLTTSDDDWPAVVANYWKAGSKWESLSMILGQEGSDGWTSEKNYKAVVQANLLFVSETWVMTPSIGRTLGRFYHKVA